jgi:hypothetical protein
MIVNGDESVKRLGSWVGFDLQVGPGVLGIGEKWMVRANSRSFDCACRDETAGGFAQGDTLLIPGKRILDVDSGAVGFAS